MIGCEMATTQVSAGDSPPAKGGKKKLLLLVAVGGLLLLGGAAGAYFLGFFGQAAAASTAKDEAAAKPAAGHGESASGEHPAAGEGAAPADQPLFVDLPDVVVNLQAEGHRLHFLKLKLVLEVADKPAADRIDQLKPRVLDSFQSYLRALSVDEVSGARGLQTIKEEMTARLNLALAPAQVHDVLVKEMLVQ